jgi:hypothetical protein
MTSQRKIGPIAAAGAVALVLIVLGVSLGWPAWSIVVAVLVCGAAGALAYLALNRVPSRPAYLPPLPAPEPPPATQLVAVQGVTLPSATPDYEFVLDATVYWRPAGPLSAPQQHVRPGARAIDTIIDRATTIAAVEDPAMSVRLQYRLNDALGVIAADPTGRVDVWADQVRISLSDADRERLRALSDLRKDRAEWEQRRRIECDKREYLTEDVLRSTGSALVWWLSRNESKVTEAADLIATMARLSAVARDEDIPELFRHLLPPELLPPDVSPFTTVGSDGAGQPFGVGFAGGLGTPVDLVAALMSTLGLNDQQRSLFAAQVAYGTETAGHVTVAAEIRRRFDALIEPEPEPEPETATNGAQAWPGEHGGHDTETPGE